MKPLIIGEAPSKRGDQEGPCAGRIGVVLADLCGLTYAEYLERFDRVNLLDKYPGAEGKGSAWEADQARHRAMHLLLLEERRETFILLGRRTAEAIGMFKDYFEWWSNEKWRMAIIPHPSGVNTWYNDVENIKRAAKFMRSVVR